MSLGLGRAYEIQVRGKHTHGLGHYSLGLAVIYQYVAESVFLVLAAALCLAFGLVYRIAQEEKPEGFVCARDDINLEDVYMYHIGRRIKD